MKKKYNAIVIFMLMLSTACGDFLDAKPELSLVIPEELNEYQAILDAEPRQMNYAPKIPLLGADEMELGEGAIPWMTQEELTAYQWEGDYYAVNDYGVDWTYGYQPIYYANVVIDGLRDFKPENEAERNLAMVLEASAKFYRAWSHFQLMQVYAPPYTPGELEQPGIPIRQSADINVATDISTQNDVYLFIMQDLEKAYEGLPEMPDRKTRPSKWAVDALRSRIYIQMQNYSKAAEAGSRALELNNDLMDFKTISPKGAYYFPRFNQEVIFHANQASTGFTFDRQQWVDSELFSLYDSTDLRRSIFFKESRTPGKFNFVSRYSGDYFDWGGLAVDEVLLDRAEALARIGNDSQSLADLNYLLINRYKGNFVPLDLKGSELMTRILLERRRELLFRGIRWMDLRRLNQDPKFAVTLKRMVYGKEKILLPGGSGYTVPIPERELENNPAFN
ncbi:RagB/SusD family nutrient uptake outer membrane protein [Algoriphagus antarcticus]|uniref:SusD-like starch-binding protein associating with outer membrane n=1 Tax=Algoriphagus antarcticus TaxID=238540 RepID=A0A3E0D4M5_9BACT|nr:RagB/SusD family nutrient uptake outer membrane protein [Algoriphagus antarcticus]REG77514.1 SusD-like starch-binding protein associating with outer membrane [Algoriphagus antarcticus]